MLLTAPVAANWDIGGLTAGAVLSVDAANIVTEFGTDADGDLPASALMFGTATVDGVPVGSLADVGFVYSPGSGTAGVFSIDTNATAFSGLGASDEAEVVIGFTVSDGTDSDTGEFSYQVDGEFFADVDFEFVFLGDTVAGASAMADDAAAGTFIDITVSIGGPADISDILAGDIELNTELDGASGPAFDDPALTIALASASDGSIATATANDGGKAQAFANENGSAQAAAGISSTAYALAEDGSTASAIADENSAASANATLNESDAAALAENDSAADATAEDNSSATATTDNSSVATATSSVDSTAVASADVTASATAFAENEGVASAAGTESSIANAVATEGSGSTASASRTSDSLALSVSGSASEAISSDGSSASATAEESSNASAVAMEGSTSTAQATGISSATAFASINSVSNAESSTGSFTNATSDTNSAASATAENGSDGTVSAANNSAADATASDATSVTTSADGTDTEQYSASLSAGLSEIETTAVGAIAGSPETAIPLPIAVTESDGETLDSIVISGLPAGSVLTAGTSNADGTEWTFTAAPPVDLALTTPASFVGQFGLSITVDNGDDSATATTPVFIGSDCSTVMPGDGASLIGEVLYVAGTDSADRISVKETKTHVQVKLNKSKPRFPLADVQQVILCGFGGNDKISRPGRSALPAVIDGGNGADKLNGSNKANDTILGGSGNDRINAKGGDDVVDGGDGNDKINAGSGNDIVRGGDGNDKITGSKGFDLLFGGAGADQIKGGGNEDILISGSTTLSNGALEDVLSKWTSSADYSDRVADITANDLNSSTILADSSPDKLTGSCGHDWFFANLADDVLKGRQNFEEVFDLGDDE